MFDYDIEKERWNIAGLVRRGDADAGAWLAHGSTTPEAPYTCSWASEFESLRWRACDPAMSTCLLV